MKQRETFIEMYTGKEMKVKQISIMYATFADLLKALRKRKEMINKGYYVMIRRWHK